MNVLFESIKRTIARMKQMRKPVEFFEYELEEQFIKSSGPGGQNANKRDTCVRLVHKPTGVSVKCSNTRHQEINRREAREMLSKALDEHINGDCSLTNLKTLELREKKAKKSAKSRKKYNNNSTNTTDNQPGSTTNKEGFTDQGSPTTE